MTISGIARRALRVSIDALRRARRSRGSIAVEFAVAIPAVIAVCALAVSAVVAASAHTLAQDIAGEAARLAARGDSPESAVTAAGHSAQLSVHDQGKFRCATVTIPIHLLGVESAAHARASSCALRDIDNGVSNGH